MQQSQEMSSESKVALGDAVDNTLGNPSVVAESAAEHPHEPEKDDLPEAAKKRLGMQEKRHKKELRKLQEQLSEMRSQLGGRPEPQYADDRMHPYTSQPADNEMDDHITRAISRALELQKMQEHKAKEAEKMQHVHKQYQALQERLDNASSKYEDFDDVVRSNDAPYTDAMRDTALLLDNADDVLYHLGKDRDKLKKLSELHPLEQAREVVRMSVALMNGSNAKDKSSNSNTQPLGHVKNKPVPSHGVSENTSVSELRAKMKNGAKRWS